MKHASNGMRTRIASWLAAAVLPWAALSTQAQQTSAAPNAATAKVPIGGKFALADASGKLVTDKTYIGKWQLIFFGFTSCPDVCSTVMAEVAAALAELGPDAARIQPLFITMDPERDTAERISEYLNAFDSRIVGLRGSQAQTEQAIKAFHVYSKQRQTGKGYTLDHSALLYWMKPDGSFGKLLSGDSGGHRLGSELRATLLQGHAS